MTTNTIATEVEIVETSLTGRQLLADSFLNKGSAFSEEERRLFGLCGLLPLHPSTFEEQLQRTYENYRSKSSPIEKYIFLAALHDRNETLFYRLVQAHIAEMVPIIYTPTVGEACQRYSHIFRRARGLYLSYPERDSFTEIFRQVDETIAVIVVTDGERILGLGDLGVGGMGIPVGKLALYTLCAGVHPKKTLPIFLDVGTNNPSLLNDPLYLGWRHPRLERKEYDHFVDRFVEAVKQRWPHALLQWEDFAKDNAWRLLRKYREGITSFNDDIQGTAAVTMAGLLRASAQAGRSLEEERIIITGAGSAATGIAELFLLHREEGGCPRADALKRIWLLDTRGLLHEGRTDLSDDKKPYAQAVETIRASDLTLEQPIGLHDAAARMRPTALIGTSGQPGLFDEALVRGMRGYLDRPIIFPLSNPTSKSEAAPEQLYRWTDGRALVASGSPFDPFEWRGKLCAVGQCNNAFIFPGMGLGLVAAGAETVPNSVFLTAAKVLAGFDQRLPGFEESLFPNLEHIREVSEKIAVAVARDILRMGFSKKPSLREDQIAEQVRAEMWSPVYPMLRRR